MVAVSAGGSSVKFEPPSRLSEAIVVAAMRHSDAGAGGYLAGWERNPWTTEVSTSVDVLGRVVSEVDPLWPADRMVDYFRGLVR